MSLRLFLLFWFFFCMRKLNNNKGCGKTLKNPLGLSGSKTCLGFLCVLAVFLEEADSHGQTHDQRGRNGVAAAGKPVLYPLNSTMCILKIWIFFQFPWLWVSHGYRKPKDQKWVVKHFKFPACNINNIRCESHSSGWNHGLVPASVMDFPHLFISLPSSNSKASHGHEVTLQPFKGPRYITLVLFQLQITSFFTNMNESKIICSCWPKASLLLLF